MRWTKAALPPCTGLCASSWCAGAVDALLRNGAVAGLKNKNGSTPLNLAVQNNGKGGDGFP
jgi:hypothetical protein